MGFICPLMAATSPITQHTSMKIQKIGMQIQPMMGMTTRINAANPVNMKPSIWRK